MQFDELYVFPHEEHSSSDVQREFLSFSSAVLFAVSVTAMTTELIKYTNKLLVDVRFCPGIYQL